MNKQNNHKYIKFKRVFLLMHVFVMASFVNIQAQIFPNPATLSTGQGAVGSIDPLWLVSPFYASSPPNPMGLTYTPALISNNCAPGSWVDPTTLAPPVNNGNWITGSGSPCSGGDGYFYFRLTLNLPTACNGNSVTIPGNYVLYLSGYVDDGIDDVFINGNSTGINGGGFSLGSQLNITLTGPWVPGINYVDVLVNNSGGGAYGLLLVANSTASANSDSDGDGISDINDQCPCLSGSLSNGCPASIVGNTVICNGGSNTTLTATGSGTYLWNTGSTNASITVSPTITTNYSVIVTTSSGFRDSSAVTVTVNSATATITPSGATSFCQGGSVLLTANNSTSYSWSPAANTQSITVNTTGTYSVTITTANGCTATDQIIVTVNPAPIVDFNSTSVCFGNETQFTDNTINTPGTIIFWSWGFGNGSLSNTTQNPSYTYPSPGTYNTTLIVNNSFGCADTLTKLIPVYYNPTVNFTHSNVCLGDSMFFTNTSSVNAATTIASYLWVFGDGSASSTLPQPVHYYSLSGTYNVTLVTTTGNGCSDAISLPVTVYDAPASSFTVNDICLFDSAHFNNTSTSPVMGNIASWLWDFGDGTPPNTSIWSPSHLYALAGNYQVTLITNSSNGCADTMQSVITVFPNPVANFTSSDVCLNQAMSFNNLSSISGGTITAWSWNFGNATSLNTTQSPSYIYTNAGTFQVALIITTNNGCKDTATNSVKVHPLPAAQFAAGNVCAGNSVQFNNLSGITPPDNIQSWVWNFDDGSPVDANQNTSHLYAGAGVYSVQLVCVSSFGCKDSINRTVVVNPTPVVNYTASDTAGCEPLCVNFQDLSTITTGNNVQWIWNLGDGSTPGTTQNSSHCFTNDSLILPISYPVSLTVTSDSGCVSTLAKTNYITVYPLPVAGFTVQPKTESIINPVISFTNQTIGANFWNWNFGDSTTSILFNPSSHTYADTGSYLINLTVSTQYGCIDNDYHTVIIEPDFVFYIPNAFTPDGDGINDTFIGKGIFIKEFEMMIFDRWGNLIYKTTDISKPWDGTANHGTEIAQTDVYVYLITIIDIKNQRHFYKGVVTLVK